MARVVGRTDRTAAAKDLELVHKHALILHERIEERQKQYDELHALLSGLSNLRLPAVWDRIKQQAQTELSHENIDFFETPMKTWKQKRTVYRTFFASGNTAEHDKVLNLNRSNLTACFPNGLPTATTMGSKAFWQQVDYAPARIAVKNNIKDTWQRARNTPVSYTHLRAHET